jgi:quinol monooxygenase YgiN
VSLLVIGTIRLPAGRLAEARPAMERMVLASRAEEGCLDYAYAEDVLEPGLIRVTEAWRDQACLDAHFATDHIAAWRAAWPALGFTDRRLSLYEVGVPRST